MEVEVVLYLVSGHGLHFDNLYWDFRHHFTIKSNHRSLSVLSLSARGRCAGIHHETRTQGNVTQHCRAPLHLSFQSHLQITAALLTESKSKSNFPPRKWFSIDPHPELIGFMSCLRRNQITVEDMCAYVCVSARVCVCSRVLCVSKRACVCVYICAHIQYMYDASLSIEINAPREDCRPIILCSCHLWSRSNDAMRNTNKV